jgi:uncharacterized protein
MHEIRHLRTADARRVPWKNGRGFTDELARWPGPADSIDGTFEWRLSRATIAAPGAFSLFPGCDRVLVVIDGDGPVLDHGGAAPPVKPARLEPCAFSGDWPTTAGLTGSPVLVLNVITRRGLWRPAVELLTVALGPTRRTVAPGHNIVHVLQGTVAVQMDQEDHVWNLGAGDSRWDCNLTRPAGIELRGEDSHNEVALVRIERPRPDNLPST